MGWDGMERDGEGRGGAGRGGKGKRGEEQVSRLGTSHWPLPLIGGQECVAVDVGLPKGVHVLVKRDVLAVSVVHGEPNKLQGPCAEIPQDILRDRRKGSN
jgi:hypothetical protein